MVDINIVVVDDEDNVIDMSEWVRKKKADIDRANRSKAIKNLLKEASKLNW